MSKIKGDSLNALAVFHVNLTTGVEEAANSFAVGLALLIPRFFFVQFE